MQQIGYDEMEALGKALSHTKRVELLRLVAVRGALSAGELTGLLGLSGGAVTGHIRALEQARLVRVEDANGVHGVKRMVSLRQDRLLLDFGCAESVQDGYEVALPIGGYVSHRAEPTCGLALRSGLIGQLDDPRYFDDPRHFQAGVLWILAGQLTYNIPNYVPRGQTLRSISITQEISSEAPGTCADWPSRLTFSLCGVELGQWVSPGDYGDRRGLCNPSWWSASLNQYGLLKTLTVNSDGAFMDGERIGNATADQLPIRPGEPLPYRLDVSGGRSGGGLTLFGSGFGNYGRDIAVHVRFDNKE